MRPTPRPIELAAPRLPSESPEVVRDRARGRTRFVSTLLVLGLAAIAGQGLVLTVSPDPRTLEIAAKTRWRAVPVEGHRGEIRTSDGVVMATSVRHPSVHIDPVAVFEQAAEKNGMPVDEVVARLADAVGLPREQVAETLKRSGRFVPVLEDVHPEIASRVEDAGLRRRGVIVSQGYRRFYPQGSFAAQLVGYVDDQDVGQHGLEAHFHGELTGAEILTQRRVNHAGAVIDGVETVPPEAHGRTLHTTLDRVVQQATESALAKVMETSAPLAATAVVVEVATGRILAMASAPTFDPNHVRDIGEDFLITQNRAVAGLYEPGSVLKPFTMAAGIEAGVVTHDDIIETGPTYSIGGRTIRDEHAHDQVTVDEMVKYSSNIAAAKVGRAVGEELLLETFARFGFGQRTGVDAQGELSGRRSPPGRIGPVELANVSFGQGITTTTLQLAMATAALANDGMLMRPLLIDRITDTSDRVVRSWVPEPIGRAVSASTAATVRRAMEMVIEPGGTGTRAAVPGYRVAGKTGTAQKAKDGSYGDGRVSTFVGYAPAEHPVLAMAVLIDDPSIGSVFGGLVAGPAFSSVMSTALRHLNIEPSQPQPDAVPPWVPSSVAAVDPVRVEWDAAAGAWLMPDLTGRPMRDAVVALHRTGAGLSFEGSGALVEQQPAAGAFVAPGTPVHLVFR